MKAKFSNTGKIQDDFFKSLVLPYTGAIRKEIKTGPKFGSDTSIISISEDLEMALCSDPLSLIPTLGLQESAWLSVHLMANDMATTGYAPQYAQFILNLPEYLTEEDFKSYWYYIHQYCQRIGTAITGGHTGKVFEQNSTIAGGGTMICVAKKDQLLSSENAQVGDVIIVTKESALIATSILALSFPESVKKHCGTEIQQKAASLFFQTSSLEVGLLLSRKKHNWINAMHDVTEGGILGAIYEMAKASNCGALIKKQNIAIGEVQEAVCSYFQIDPLYSIGAGSMVIAAKKEHVNDVLLLLNTNGISANEVGVFTPITEGINSLCNDERQELHYPESDPYWSAFYEALKKGLK